MANHFDPAGTPSARRAFFPRGLAQPEKGFRFAADTLLLAAFAARTLGGGSRPLEGLDVGTGCGAASLGLLLLLPERPFRIVGIDADPEMLACCRENAAALGYADRLEVFRADAADFTGPVCDFALMNPPFRSIGSGRMCPRADRGAARFEGEDGFAPFAACAARNLRTRGRLFLVHLSERLPELCVALLGKGLSPKRILPVQGRAGLAPRLILLDAVRGGGPGLDLRPPLVLYDAAGGLTPEAEEFCPPLAANARRSANAGPRPLAKELQRG